MLDAHQGGCSSDEVEDFEQTLPLVPSLVPSQRIIVPSRKGLLVATSQKQKKPSAQDVRNIWEHSKHKKREGHAWSIRVGVFGQNRTIVEPLTPFLCVVENKGPINEDNIFKLVGRIIDVRENRESGTVYCLVQEQEKEFENDQEKKYAVNKLTSKDFKMKEVHPLSRRDKFKDAMLTRKRVSQTLVILGFVCFCFRE